MSEVIDDARALEQHYEETQRDQANCVTHRICDCKQRELDAMRAWGDQMQSEASRLAEAVRSDGRYLRYEAALALSAIESLVGDWTKLRVNGQ